MSCASIARVHETAGLASRRNLWRTRLGFVHPTKNLRLTRPAIDGKLVLALTCSSAASGYTMLRWIFAAVLLSACAPVREPTPAPAEQALPTDRARGTDFRVLSWNVSRENFYERSTQFRAVLRAIDADILIIDEMPAAADESKMVTALAGLGNASGDWQVVYGISGYRQRSTIASQLPMQRLSGFDHLQYSEQLAQQWLATTTDTSREKMRRSIAAGMAQVGALIDANGGQVLTVGLDFECCGSGGDSREESMRRDEAAKLRAALDLEISRHSGQGIVVGGDFNAVNGPAPLLLVQGKEDLPGHLSIAKAVQFDGIDLWTWDGRGTPFASGRLDYQMHNDRLRVVSSWVFDTADLTTEQQRRLGLQGIQMSELSQHRPVVVDYAWVQSAAN